MIKIGTWNLENLFRPGPDGPSTDAAYTAKLDALAATIRVLAPDVLAVQEIGDPDALKDLTGKLDGYEHTATAAPDGRGIRVGFLSRLPLQGVREAAALPDGLRPIQVDDTPDDASAVGRAVLIAQVQTAGHTVSLVTCHLKSKLLTFPGGRFSTTDEAERARFGAYALYRRAAEAVTVRAVATELLAGDGQNRAVLVLGDLNDEPEAATTSWGAEPQALKPLRAGPSGVGGATVCRSCTTGNSLTLSRQGDVASAVQVVRRPGTVMTRSSRMRTSCRQSRR